MKNNLKDDLAMKEKKLNAFDKVLVRDTDNEEWRCSIYSHKYEDARCCINGYWAQCIPYEGNEKLLGTIDPYDEPHESNLLQKGTFITTPRGAILICSGRIGNHHGFQRIGTIVHLSCRQPYSLKINNPGDRCYNLDLDIKNGARLSTEEEKELLISKLHEIGKDWDAEKKEVVDYVEPYEPKDGDFVVCEDKKECARSIFIFKEWKGIDISMYCIRFYSESKPIVGLDERRFYSDEGFLRPATDSEKQLLLSKLHEIGKDWDAETKEIVDWKWRPKYGEVYYTSFFDKCEGGFVVVKVVCNDDKNDIYNYEKSWVFHTEEECKSMCDKLNEAIKNVK